MDLCRYDGKLVRIETADGMAYEGPCEHESSDYVFHEYGVDEDALSIEGWIFYSGDIRAVYEIEPKDNYIWMNRMQHFMKIAPEPYDMIVDEIKIFELRLYDEKRQKIHPGDVISFESTGDETDVWKVLVKDLHVFDSFAELYRSLPLLKCGYTPDNVDRADPADMDRYYPPEEQQKYRVVAIELMSFEEL